MSSRDVHQDVFDADDGLASFATDLRAAADETPLPVVGDALTRLFADGLAVAPTPAAARARRRTLRRRVAIVLGAGVALTGGGLGAVGALPGPVQRAVSDVADVIGIELPSDDESDDAPSPVPPSTAPAPPATVQEAPPASAPPTSAPPTSAPPTTPVPTTAAPADDATTTTTTPARRPETPPSNPRADERPDQGQKRPEPGPGQEQRAEDPSTERLQDPEETEVDDQPTTRARAHERRPVTPPSAVRQLLEVDTETTTEPDEAPATPTSDISRERP